MSGATGNAADDNVDICHACGKDRSGAMFECPHCGEMPKKKGVSELGLNTRIQLRLGEGYRVDEVAAELAAEGMDSAEAFERVRKVNVLSEAVGNEQKLYRADERRAYTKAMVAGVPLMIISGALLILFGAQGKVPIYAVFIFMGSTSAVLYGLSRHWRVFTGEERMPRDDTRVDE